MTFDPPDSPPEKLRIPRNLPVLPLRDLVVYPFIIVPLSISRDISINAVDQALSGRRMVLLLSQKDAAVDDPQPSDLYPIGTVAVMTLCCAERSSMFSTRPRRWLMLPMTSPVNEGGPET